MQTHHKLCSTRVDGKSPESLRIIESSASAGFSGAPAHCIQQEGNTQFGEDPLSALALALGR